VATSATSHIGDECGRQVTGELSHTFSANGDGVWFIRTQNPTDGHSSVVVLVLITLSIQLSTTRDVASSTTTQELARIFETQSFTADFTSVLHFTLSTATPFQYLRLHTVSPRSISILSTQLIPALPNCLLPSGFANFSSYYSFSSSPNSCDMPCPS
jgi:hypothetical protein